MMVAVDSHERLDAHPKEACGLPGFCPGLHQPRCCCVAQSVWRHLTTQTSVFHGAAKGFLDALDWLAVPLDGEALSASMPAAQVSQKLSRLRFSLACWSAIEHAAI